MGDWSACSATCDGGIQQREPICFESIRNEMVDEEFCWSSAENYQPNKKIRVCNDVPCPAHWWIGPWQLCPVTCKRHSNFKPSINIKSTVLKLKSVFLFQIKLIQ